MKIKNQMKINEVIEQVVDDLWFSLQRFINTVSQIYLLLGKANIIEFESKKPFNVVYFPVGRGGIQLFSKFSPYFIAAKHRIYL